MSNIKSVDNNQLRAKDQKKPKPAPDSSFSIQGKSETKGSIKGGVERADRVELSAAAQEVLKKYREKNSLP
jgi:hypothetical protein